MAEERSSGNGFIYFVIGALVVAVAVIAYIALANNGGGDSAEISIDTPDIEAPDLPGDGGGDVDVEVDAD